MHPVRFQIETLLEAWGEVIIHTASGQTWEIHAGDMPELLDAGIEFKTATEQHVIFYDQIERLTVHKAHSA